MDSRLIIVLVFGVFIGAGALLGYLKKSGKFTSEAEKSFVDKAEVVISAFSTILPFIVPETQTAEVFNKVISYVNVALSYLNEDSKEATNSIDNAITHAKEIAEKDGIKLTDEQYQAIKSTLEIFMANPKVISEVVNQPVPQKEVPVVAPVENTVNAEPSTITPTIEVPITSDAVVADKTTTQDIKTDNTVTVDASKDNITVTLPVASDNSQNAQ